MNNLQSQLKYGLLAGVILIPIKYILVVSIPGISLKLFAFDYLSTFAVLGIISFFAITNQRNNNGGMVSFREAFFIGLIVAFITALIAGAFQYAYAAYIDPGRAERMVQATIEYMKHTSETEASKKNAVDNARLFYSPAAQFQAGMSSLVVGLFISLIVALTIKKDVRNNQTTAPK